LKAAAVLVPIPIIYIVFFNAEALRTHQPAMRPGGENRRAQTAIDSALLRDLRVSALRTIITKTKLLFLAMALVVFVLGFASCGISLYEPYFQVAEKYYGEGDYTRAIAMYIKAIGENDKLAETYYGLAMAYYWRGDLEEAMLAFEKTISLDPKNESAYERLASVHLDLGNPDTALTICKKAINLDREFVGAYNTLGHAFLDSGRLDSAEATFTYAVKLAKRLVVRDRGIQDQSLYLDEQSEAFNGLGELSNARRQYKYALEYFASSISLTPQWDTPWTNKGVAYEGLGNSVAAQVCYQRAIDLSIANLTAYKKLAEFYRRIGKDYDALNVYRSALRVDPSNIDMYYGLADVYEKKGDHLHGIEAFEHILKYAPDDPIGYVRIAQLYLRDSDYDQAITYFEQATQLDTRDAEAYDGLGEALQAKGMLKEARGAYEKAVACNSLYTLPLRHLGSLYISQGKEAEGLRYFLRAAALGDIDAIIFLRSQRTNEKKE
jgi:tetratricopeptide (TPR) repeat protein